MRIFILVATLTLFSMASQANLVDGWKVSKRTKVEASTLTRPDGTVIQVPPTEEVVLVLALETASKYGSPEQRNIKSKRVELPQAGAPGRIFLDIEPFEEFICRPEDGGFSLGMMGPHDAITKFVLKAGTYTLTVDGVDHSTVTIDDGGQTITPLQSYAPDLEKKAFDRFQQIFGGFKFEIVRDANNNIDCSGSIVGEDKWILTYDFPEVQTTLADGDRLIKPARKGSSEVTIGAIDTRCYQNKLSWELSFKSSDRTLTGKVNIDEEGKKTISVTSGNRTCSWYER